MEKKCKIVSLFMGWKLVVIRKLTIEWNKISILKNLNVYSPPKFRIELYIYGSYWKDSKSYGHPDGNFRWGGFTCVYPRRFLN